MLKRLFLFSFLAAGFIVVAQPNVKDSSLLAPMFTTNFAYQIPGGDMAKRFRANANMGFSVLVKTKGKWVFGADWSFLFGKKIKEDGILDSIANSDNYLINSKGEYANVKLYERGYSIGLKAGRLFNVLAPNPNSGILVMAGPGFLQHKIRIYDHFNAVPQVDGEYKKGYDRLTNGLSFTAFIGYVYLGNSRLINFFGGFEFTQAFTKSRRSYDYDLRKRDTTQRTDLLTGFRIGWILPLYVRGKNEYF